jgi:hypothetical protein
MSNKVFSFDFRVREIQTRQVRDGNALLFQSRILIHNHDGTLDTSLWLTTGSASNYGDVYDPKPTLMDRIKGFFNYEL